MKQARATSFITLVRDVYDLFMDIGHVLVCKLSVLFEIQYDSHWYSFWTENHDGNLKVVWLTAYFSDARVRKQVALYDGVPREVISTSGSGFQVSL